MGFMYTNSETYRRETKPWADIGTPQVNPRSPLPRPLFLPHKGSRTGIFMIKRSTLGTWVSGLPLTLSLLLRQHTGNVLINSDGEGELIVESDALKVWDIIGMSVVVKEGEDDLGRGENEQSAVDGNSGRGVAYGIIARSAGFGENRKKVCLCDSKEF